MLLLPPTASNLVEWVRKCATAVNFLLGRQGLPFPSYDADPPSPQPGSAYYNTTTNKARVYDGTTWNNLW